LPARTIARHQRNPVGQLEVGPVLRGKSVHQVAPEPVALWANYLQVIEPADQMVKRVDAVAGHDRRDFSLTSELLTYGTAKMSGFGAEPERTGLGPHALPQKGSPFHGVCAVKTKNRTGIGPHLRMRKRQ